MAAVEEAFMEAVEEGLKLSTRLYFGKDRSVAPPKPPPSMSKNPTFYLPTAPMVYAVISDPGIVDNPDIPSYQPYVYGRCDPPALIPLQMNSVSLEVDCYLDTVFVRVSGQWRVHCVMGSKVCDCRLAVPMGEQYRDHVKDLSCISPDLCRVVIVDNNPFSFLLQPVNGIPCVPFSAGQPHDDQLLEVLLPLLKHLSVQDDVRPVLYEKFHMPEWFQKHGIPSPGWTL